MSDATAPTFSPSLWLDGARPTTEALAADRTCDVVVVGGGYTGLSAALTLARAGASVVVLEASHVGFGASGRNAGHLTPTIGKDLPTLRLMYGRRVGAELVALAEEAVAFTEARIDEHAIDCDLVAAGNVIAGLHEGQRGRIEGAVETARGMGAQIRMLERAELDERRLPAFVACGAIETVGGVLDPGRYLLGLRDAALAAGAVLCEQSPVVELVEHGRGVVASTPAGSVFAGHAVLATNAHTPRLRRNAGHLVPLRDSQFVTEPLTAEQRERVGWSGGEGIYTVHESLENYRWTADGRIVGGSRYVRYRYGSGFSPDHDPTTFASVAARFRDRFPELADVAIAGFWSGHVAMNLNFLPFIGPTGDGGRVIASVAYNGHGLALAGLLGHRAAEVVLGVGSAPPALVERRRIPLPPEPLRWAAVGAMTAATEWMDRRTDGRARPRCP